MKKIILALFVLMVGLLSCNEDGTPLVSFFNTDNLDAQFFDINIGADTILHTKNGATISIKKNAITAGNARSVKLEVKEAYGMEAIVKAGLSTQSDGKPLSSGGMIYIDVKDNKDAKIVSPIGISLPSDNLQEGMQLFKGEKDKDGNINWIAPQPLEPNKTLDTIAAGKALFVNNCSSCHRLTKDATGPALAFAPQRLDRDWLDHWIWNSAAMIAYGDPYANCIFERYNKTAMTAFPNLSREDLDKLYKYLDQESKNYNPADFPDYKAAFDSCQIYNSAKQALLEKRGKLVLDNGPEVSKDQVFPGPVITLIGSEDTSSYPVVQNFVKPKASNSTYYQFNISSFGWYNIDIFTKDIPGFEPSVVKAKVAGAHNEFTNIYIIIPDAKIFVDGGLLKGESDVYGFYTDDGNLPLPQGKEAYIMAFTEKDDKITFGFTRFVTGRDNEITVTPKVVTKEFMNQKIKELNFKDLAIQADDSKHADTIRKVDIDLQNIESLKPKGTDCNCGMSLSDTASVEGMYRDAR